MLALLREARAVHFISLSQCPLSSLLMSCAWKGGAVPPLLFHKTGCSLLSFLCYSLAQGIVSVYFFIVVTEYHRI